MHKVLLFCSHRTSVSEYQYLAQELPKYGKFDIAVLFSSRGYFVSASNALADGLGENSKDYYVFEEDHISLPQPTTFFRVKYWLMARCIILFEFLTRGYFAGLYVTWSRFAYDLRLSEAYLREIKPDLVILPGDRRITNMLPMLMVANRLGLHSLIYSSALISSERNLITRRLQREDTVIRGMLRKVARQLPTSFKIWDEEKDLSFYALGPALALALQKCWPYYSWIMGGSRMAGGIAVHGPIDKDLIVSSKALSEDCVHVIGQPILDELYHDGVHKGEQQEKLRSKYDISPCRKILVFAVPQYFSDAPNYSSSDLIDICQVAVEQNYDVICSLHPKSKLEDFQYLQELKNVHIESSELKMVLGGADIFIASYSSTIRWAMMLGIPTAVVDFHEENCPIFDAYKSIKILKDAGEFQHLLLDYADLENYSKVSAELKEMSAGEIRFDGQATKSFATVIENVLAS